MVRTVGGNGKGQIPIRITHSQGFFRTVLDALKEVFGETFKAVAYALKGMFR